MYFFCLLSFLECFSVYPFSFSLVLFFFFLYTCPLSVFLLQSTICTALPFPNIYPLHSPSGFPFYLFYCHFLTQYHRCLPLFLTHLYFYYFHFHPLLFFLFLYCTTHPPLSVTCVTSASPSAKPPVRHTHTRLTGCHCVPSYFMSDVSRILTGHGACRFLTLITWCCQ